MPANNSKRFIKQSIPTILGMLFLILALISGLILFKDGFSGFMPRANPQTTPRDIRISNLTNSSFTVSFYTQEPTFAKINYSTRANSLSSRIRDERDQFQEVTGEYTLHYLTLSNLKPETDYFFSINTEAGEIKDEEGKPFKITTSPISTTLALAKTIYGNIVTSDGKPAEGSIVYLKIPGFEELSSLVKPSGSWAISLSEIRNIKSKKVESIRSGSKINLVIKGANNTESLLFETTIDKAQPVEDLQLERNVNNTISEDSVSQQIQDDDAIGEVRGTDTTKNLSNVIDLQELSQGENPVTVSEPIIRGQASVNSKVKISIHSDNNFEVEVTTDNNGWFEIDLADFGESLEPGNHTITYTYFDPELGLERTKEYNFIVTGGSQLIAQATGGDQPYGSGNPYSTPTPTIILTATPTVVAEPLPEAGSGDMTALIIIAGLLFVTAGVASWNMAKSFEY